MMLGSDWKGSSGRKGSPKIPPAKSKDIKCPQCKQEVLKYPDGSIERHKIYKKGSKTVWAWCTRRKV